LEKRCIRISRDSREKNGVGKGKKAPFGEGATTKESPFLKKVSGSLDTGGEEGPWEESKLMSRKRAGETKSGGDR